MIQQRRGETRMNSSVHGKTSIGGFLRRIQRDHVGAFAAQAAYFLIMAFIPFVLFLTTLIRYTPLTFKIMQEAIISVIPVGLQPYVLDIVAEVYGRSNAIVPVTALAALWSAGKALQSITNGLNAIYHVRETRNWLVTRIYSVFYTLLLVIAIIASLILLVFGNSIQKMLAKYVPLLGKVVAQIIGARTFLVFLTLMVVFMFLYKALPNRKSTLRSQTPGAVFTSIAWSVFSYFFSLYVEFFPGVSNMYGSVAMLILVMLWTNVCMNIVLYGAEINAYFEKDFRHARVIARELFEKEKENF